MSLVDKKSMLDRNVKGNEGNLVGQNPPNEGSFFTDRGNSRSPFTSKGDESDHLVALLKDQIVASGNSGLTYDPEKMKIHGQAPTNAIESFPDLNGKNLTPFQKPTDKADIAHKESLFSVPQPPSNSPFQDRLDANNDNSPSGYKSNGPLDGFY
tara:strand:- start:3007 stop:3468 length:462 start_codon:yes stop_codon:yes gene_type:complete